MKHSIKYKMSALIVIVMLSAILIGGALGSIFVEKYYISTKQDTIISVYDKLKKMSKDDINLDSTESITELNNTCEKHGVTVIVVDQAGEAIYEYGGGKILSDRWQDILSSGTISEQKQKIVIEHNDNYTLQSTKDKYTNQKHYELYGTLDSGGYFVIRVSVESIQESIGITNKFYLYLCLGMIILVTIIMLIVTRRYTDPLLELASISAKMSNLDFDAKYTGKHQDELGILGKSMNEMSDKLEATILELKTANLELKKDIEKKVEIDEMRKEFISNVSHELKTPIALVQGYAEGLKENINDDPESMEYYCDVIMDEADKMNKMVKQLLNLTQIEFGNKQVNMERFDISSVVEGILNSVALKAEKENVKIIFEDRQSIFVWADEFQVEEVITNYVSNAFNHIDGEKIIRVKIVEKNGIVRVSVFNTGKTIPQNELENIWIKFYKVDKARTRAYGGNGIGLSIVKAIMDSMNKQCGVINHVDGVEFWFELDSNPLEEGQAVNDSNN